MRASPNLATPEPSTHANAAELGVKNQDAVTEEVLDALSTYEAQSAFNFYLVALAFSVLGLAVKSFDTEVRGVGRFLEMSAWLSLLVSALFALSYLEWSSRAQDLNTVSEKLQAVISEASTMSGADSLQSNTDTDKTITRVKSDYLRRLHDQEKQLKDTHEDQLISDSLKYRIAKWGFLLGVLLLAVSRLHFVIRPVES